MQTILHDRHLSLGAKMVDFAGWMMPVQYKGIVEEHRAVREHAGLFDVSHMGRVIIRGKDAESFLDFLSTNKIKGRKIGTAAYTVFCNAQGGSVDDVIIYRTGEYEFFTVVNASNRQKDLAHIQSFSEGYEIEVISRFKEDGLIALQGPAAPGILAQLFPQTIGMKPMRVLALDGFIISSTGYTGEKGFEICAANEKIPELWDGLISLGAIPVGLGARDTLRLEMGYALYGHELSEETFPTESVAAWTVRMDKEEFLGKDALRKRNTPHAQYGVILSDPGVPREGYPVFLNEEQIGHVTSGTFSPSLEKGICIIIGPSNLTLGQELTIRIRARQAKGSIVSLPFYKKEAK